MKECYFETVAMVERLHRLFLDVVSFELKKRGIDDINSTQSLVLYNIGKGQVTVGALTNRGYYLGSNVSYNLKKMVENGYVKQSVSPHDRRSSHVKLSSKGLELYKTLDSIFSDHGAKLFSALSEKKLKELCETLKDLERFWSGISS